MIAQQVSFMYNPEAKRRGHLLKCYQILNLQLFSEYPCKVIVENKGHQDQENKEAYLLGHFPFLNANGLPDDQLYEEKKDHAAV